MTANRPNGHVPNFPAWSAVCLPALTAFCMIFSRGPGDAATVDELMSELTSGADTPDHLERARVVNAADHVTVFLGYWTDPESQQRWSRRSRALSRPGVLEGDGRHPCRALGDVALHPGDHPGSAQPAGG